MIRILAAPVLTQKSLVSVALLAAIVLASFLLVRQIHQTAAVGTGTAHNLTTPVTQPRAISSESSASEDSFNSSDSSRSSSNNSNSLTVNGQDIPLPANGTVNQTLTDGDSTTTINAQTSSSSDGQGNASNSSSVNVQVNSHSESR